MLDQLHVYDDLEPRAAAQNMAIDEALLETASAPALRFYRWRYPAVSFGYFGRFADAARESEGKEIVRRWTGGGVVQHGRDLTYSIIVPAGHAFSDRTPAAIYPALHEAIRRVFEENGIKAALAAASAPKVSEHCFANAVRADVVSDGQKIAGAAQRRARAGLLHQGSIQYEKLPSGFADQFAERLCAAFESRAISQPIIVRATQIAENKYGTVEWLMRR